VQTLIAWYTREIAVADTDPVSQWPWAFGRFSDGTPVEPVHRWLYREHSDLRSAFPDPWDASSTGLTYLGWCETEGRLRHPQLFSEHPDFDAVRSSTLQYRVSLGTMLRLSRLMMSPRAGKPLRDRLYRMLRREGLRGLARRLPGPRT
jgi:hypothetical protein